MVIQVTCPLHSSGSSGVRMACPQEETPDEKSFTGRIGRATVGGTPPPAEGVPRMTETVPRPTHVGRSLPRREDAALLTGRGTWTDDIAPPGTLHLALVRSPVAHARITAVDTATAREHAGVVAVLTGADLAGEFVAGIPCGWPVTEDILVPDHRPLARDEVNHVGDAV